MQEEVRSAAWEGSVVWIHCRLPCHGRASEKASGSDLRAAETPRVTLGQRQARTPPSATTLVCLEESSPELPREPSTRTPRLQLCVISSLTHRLFRSSAFRSAAKFYLWYLVRVEVHFFPNGYPELEGGAVFSSWNYFGPSSKILLTMFYVDQFLWLYMSIHNDGNTVCCLLQIYSISWPPFPFFKNMCVYIKFSDRLVSFYQTASDYIGSKYWLEDHWYLSIISHEYNTFVSIYMVFIYFSQQSFVVLSEQGLHILC